MVKRRAPAAGIPISAYYHTFRATGMTGCQSNGGIIEKVQAIAAHESRRTTKLYVWITTSPHSARLSAI